MKKYDIAVIGGDKRTACMAPVFEKMGYSVITCGTAALTEKGNPYSQEANGTESVSLAKDASLCFFQEAVSCAGVIVCGIPFEQKGNLFFQEPFPPVTLTELQRFLRRQQKVFGGAIPENFRQRCEEREIQCCDFLREETLTLHNAIATAEGAILEAMLHSQTTLHHSPCLVLGYGRCGRVLAGKLQGINARVTVCSSDAKELALADSMGLDTQPLLLLQKKSTKYAKRSEGCRTETGYPYPADPKEFSYVFNTIPALILKEDFLRRLASDCLVIDIASNQGGVDYEGAKRLGIRALHCLGLPGKYAACSSAKRLCEYVADKL